MVKKEIHDLLIRSLDEEFPSSEMERLERLLSESPELREERRKLLEMRRIISSKQYSFSDGFQTKVMDRIAEENEPLILQPEFNRSLFTVFKRVALTGVAAILILFLSIYLSNDSFTLETLTGGDSYSDDNLVSYLLYEEINQ